MRRFGPDRSLHHLIDPATGEPAQPGPLAVTVVAPDAAEAEAHATALAISSPREAEAHVAAHRAISALYVPHEGAPIPLGEPPLRDGPHPAERGMSGTLPGAWLVARAAGLVALGLLTLSVWLGLAMSTRLLGPKRQKGLLGLHRTLVWTGLAMIGLHAVALLLDPVLHFGVLLVLMPFAAPWKSGALHYASFALRSGSATPCSSAATCAGSEAPWLRSSQQAPCCASPSTGCSSRGRRRDPPSRRRRSPRRRKSVRPDRLPILAAWRRAR